MKWNLPDGQTNIVPKRWVVTGAAGFIGSNLVEALLDLDQYVVGLDNLATGHLRNLDQIQSAMSSERWSRFQFVEGDIRDIEVCRSVSTGADHVLHQAALGSVPRSTNDPIAATASNIVGFVNMLVASRDSGIKRFVYAASSSTYGDHPGLPKVEEVIGKPMSPYAVTKYANELYAGVFTRCYGIETIGLRYFNVFGRRQDPDGAYAAVIPKWISSMMRQEPVEIFGDGETSRDFCYIDNVIQANLLAATSLMGDEKTKIYNIAYGGRTSLNTLFRAIRSRLVPDYPHLATFAPTYREFRPGDITHSHASIAKAKAELGFVPSHSVESGLDEAMVWYLRHLRD